MHLRVLPLLVCTLISVAAAAHGDCLFPVWTSAPTADVLGSSVAAGDLNADGWPDVAGASYYGVRIALNDGNGTFAAPSTLVYSRSVFAPPAIANVAGDGSADVVLLDAAAPAIVVLPGRGDGTFGPPVLSPIPVPRYALAVADFDKDGRTDVAFRTDTDIRIHRGNGDGTFVEAAVLTPQTAPTLFMAADIDGDGNADIASGSERSARLDLFFGNGDGTFAAVVVQPAMTSLRDLIAADLDGDGHLELIGASASSSLAIMRNLTGRTFGDPLLTAGTSGVYLLAAADMTGDGAVDVVASGAQGNVTTFAGTGSGLIARSATVKQPFRDSFADLSAPADFDGDGRLDLLAARYDGTQDPVVLLRNVCVAASVSFDAARVVTVGTTNRVTVNVAPAAGMTLMPAGTLTLSEGDAVLGVQQLTAGQATFDLSLAAAEHTFTASYEGDEQYAPASATFTQTVTNERTTTTLTLPAEIEYGRLLTASATITSTIPASIGANAVFYLDGVKTTPLSHPPSPPNAWSGRPGAGTHTLEARFPGDNTHPPSSSGPIPFIVRKAMPDVRIQPRVVRNGQEFDLFVKVSIASALQVVQPSGTLTVSRGTTTPVTKPHWHSFPSGALAPPRQFFRIQYPGDANYLAFDRDEPVTVHSGDTTLIDARGTADVILVATSPHSSIYRREPGGWLYVRWNTFDDTSRAPGAVTVYRPETGLADVAMRVSFTDEFLRPGMIVRAVHVAEVVAALNRLRTAAGLGPSQVSITPAMPVAASHLLTLQTEIAEARSALGAYAFAFTGAVAPGEPMRAIHLVELREAIR